MSVTTRSRKKQDDGSDSPSIAEEGGTVASTPTIKKKKVYALTPALMSNEPIDYGSTAGAKIYKQATEKLKTEYDLKGE